MPKRSALTVEACRSRASYTAVLGAAALCYSALGAVLRLLPDLAGDRAALGLLVGAPR